MFSVPCFLSFSFYINAIIIWSTVQKIHPTAARVIITHSVTSINSDSPSNIFSVMFDKGSRKKSFFVARSLRGGGEGGGGEKAGPLRKIIYFPASLTSSTFNKLMQCLLLIHASVLALHITMKRTFGQNDMMRGGRLHFRV